jgi:hypothetical protein
MKANSKAMLASYGRSVVGAVIAVYMTGATNPTDYVKAAIDALIPPVMRWVNPNDNAFGRSK